MLASSMDGSRESGCPGRIRYPFFATDQASIICKATGNLRAVQIRLGHTKNESTVRYLRLDVKDALTLAEGTEI